MGTEHTRPEVGTILLVSITILVAVPILIEILVAVSIPTAILELTERLIAILELIEIFIAILELINKWESRDVGSGPPKLSRF